VKQLKLVIHRTLPYPYGSRPLQLWALGTAVYRTRTLRGAVCGAVAAAVWALEQPLDKLLFGGRYDDVELLGRAVVQGDGWYPAGIALHIGNGALFGALYSNVAPVLPLPAVLRGPSVALTEHLAVWPLTMVTDRFHPARKQLPKLTGNRAAFAQATVRHLVFGIVLGELERRLNASPEPAPLLDEADFSSNGHGSIEHAISAESAG
jgi:hypothetical protein